MIPKQRLNILLADDGSQHVQAAVEWLQNIPLPPKSRIFVFRAFHFGQIPLISEFERALDRTKTRLSSLGYRVETERLTEACPLLGLFGPDREETEKE